MAKPKGSGGSAFKRLKSNLKDAGVIGPKSKKLINKYTKSKSTTSATSGSSRMKEIKDRLKDMDKKSLNPFEVKFTRQKHDVLGRKMKGIKGKPGLTKLMSEENRKKTLLVELQRKNKNGSFIDRRFGENNPNLSIEDKMMERFVKEKQKTSLGGGGGRKSNVSLFNLDDNEDGDMNGDELTHFGQSLSALDDYSHSDLRLLGDSDDEDMMVRGAGGLDSKLVSKSHFGGFDEDREEGVNDDGRPKSRREIMAEVIAKSKHYKQERQKQREENETLRKQLDGGLDEIRELLGVDARNQPLHDHDHGRHKDMDPNERLLNKLLGKDRFDPATANPNEREDDYDKIVKEMVFDRRARATDRIKTDEELLAEEVAKLKKLEEKRIRKMQGLDGGDDEDQDGNSRRLAQADDLGDDYFVSDDDERDVDAEGGRRHQNDRTVVYTEDGRLVHQLSEVEIRKRKNRNAQQEEEVEEEEEDEEDEDEEMEEYESGDEEEGSEEDSDEEEEGSEEDSDEEEESLEEDEEMTNALGSDADLDEFSDNESTLIADSSSTKSSLKQLTTTPTTPEKLDLAYTYLCPSTHDQFLAYVQNRPISDVMTIVQRIRLLYHIKLQPQNKEKMKSFFNVLLDHVYYLCEPENASSYTSPELLNYFNQLTKHICDLASLFPDHVTQVFITQIDALKTTYSTRYAGTFPPLKDIMLLKLIGHLFATSDLEHRIVNASELVISMILSQSRVRCLNDFVAGLVLVQVLVEYEYFSKRFVPEVLNFLNVGLYLLVPRADAFVNRTEIPGIFPVTDSDLEMNLFRMNNDEEEKEMTSTNLDFIQILSSEPAATIPETTKQSLLETTWSFISQFSKMYSEFTSFDTLFSSSLLLMGKFTSSQTQFAQQSMSNIAATITSHNLKRRQLQLQKHKPKSIATYIPRFEDQYSIDKHYDPNKKRSESSKNIAAYKKEFKGAIRELRKDNAFVQREKIQEIRRKDKEYKAKINSIMGQLGDQEGEAKGLDRLKSKIKKMK